MDDAGSKTIQVKNKDYMIIINTIIHMLEDKNMLVFVEAIKTVELLARILGPHNLIKTAKIKLIIGLLAGKYGETKTAVISAVDKSMDALVSHAISQTMFVEVLLNQVAFNHKNPRVKQFVIDHTLEQLIKKNENNQDQVSLIFKVIREKLV